MIEIHILTNYILCIVMIYLYLLNNYILCIVMIYLYLYLYLLNNYILCIVMIAVYLLNNYILCIFMIVIHLLNNYILCIVILFKDFLLITYSFFYLYKYNPYTVQLFIRNLYGYYSLLVIEKIFEHLTSRL
jgi:hypothetical protein